MASVARFLCVFLCMTLLPAVESMVVFGGFDKVAFLSETTNSNTFLSALNCSDDSGSPVIVEIDSIVPSEPCGRCFDVLNCGTVECLEYRAGTGDLSYSRARSYSITVSCRNANPLESPITEVVYVIITPNMPPYFDPLGLYETGRNTGIARNIGPGRSLYKVTAREDDLADTITYSLTTYPSEYNDMFTIASDGVIENTVPLRAVCTRELTFEVEASDGTSTSGTKVIAYTLNEPNQRPFIANLDNEIEIPEDTSGRFFVMRVIDANPNKGSYTYTSTNQAGLAQYTIDGRNLNFRVAGKLDYEKPSLRETDVTIDYTDGSCTSGPSNLRIRVKDVNEPPVINPVTSDLQVCEGTEPFDPGLTVTDEDVGDTQRWTIHRRMQNGPGFFNIEENSGLFMVSPDYDIDQNRRNAMVRYIVQVEDKGGLTATAVVNVRFLDCNDNAPVFDQPSYTFTTTQCTPGGTTLGRVAASDDDFAREDNNVITYSGSGGAVSINSAGEVILHNALKAGTVLNFNGVATDQGKTPGPLTSVVPAKVSVIFTECPPPPTPPATTTPVATAAPTTVVTLLANSSSLDGHLPWIILSAILGAIFLGLLTFMCWKYGALLQCSTCKGSMCKDTYKIRPSGDDFEEDGDFDDEVLY